MRDTEIALRYIAYKIFIQHYSGNLKQFLDKTTKELNSSWDTQEQKIRVQVKDMNNVLLFTKQTFKEKSYLRKWTGEEFEARKNRAIFEIVLHYFSCPKVRKALQEGNPIRVVEKFKDLCANNSDFRSSIVTTTKSRISNRNRFDIWGNAVGELSGVDVSSLKFPEDAAIR